jgi:tripeptidyl-peptidase-1
MVASLTDQVVTARDLEPSGGTSASAPVVGAIFGLLNDARLKAGLPSMGFINPWLYQSGSQFVVDIVGGASRGCDGVNHQTGKSVVGAAKISYASWNATAGWDPATGLGVPDFQRMLKAVTQKGNSYSNKARDDDDDDDEDGD